MKNLFFVFFSMVFAKVFFGKDNFNFLDVSNFKIDITQEDIDKDLMKA